MNDRALARFLDALDHDLAREDQTSPFDLNPIGSGERMYRTMERLAQAGVSDEQAADLLRADVERRSWLAEQTSQMA